MTGDRPLLVGVTGGIGSGKSTLCGYLQDCGCALFEADRVARELQLSDPDIVQGIRRIFGDEAYGMAADGTLVLERRRIAAAAFSSPDMLAALNALVHPKVYEAFGEAVGKAKQEGRKILLLEAAILLQSDRYADLDLVVVVAADEAVRIARAVTRGMGSEEEVRRRMRAQWPQERMLAEADLVVWNNGGLEALRLEADLLFARLLGWKDARKGQGSGGDCP